MVVYKYFSSLCNATNGYKGYFIIVCDVYYIIFICVWFIKWYRKLQNSPKGQDQVFKPLICVLTSYIDLVLVYLRLPAGQTVLAAGYT